MSLILLLYRVATRCQHFKDPFLTGHQLHRLRQQEAMFIKEQAVVPVGIVKGLFGKRKNEGYFSLTVNYKPSASLLRVYKTVEFFSERRRLCL